MADDSVDHGYSVRFEELLVNPAYHPDPTEIAHLAECESGGLLEEIKAVAEVLALADQNQDTQINEDNVSYVANAIRRLVEQKQALDSLAFRAREAMKQRAGNLHSATR